MNIRYESKGKSYLTPPPHFILAVLVAIVVASSLLFINSPARSVDSTAERDTASSMAKVIYNQVPSGRKDAQRFIAKSPSDEPISIKSWMALVASKSEEGIKAATDLSNVISTSPYESILFETMGTSWSSSETTPFEFAMIHKPALKRFAEAAPDRSAFDEHFRKCIREYDNNGKGLGDRNSNAPTVCSFGNLGGDALLVSPLPQKEISDDGYSHLAAFVRNAPTNQIAEFWALGASQYLIELKNSRNRKRWFSTNGMGVAWLHLRLDARPKYYSYDPFT